ncbi:Pkinase-domain-containing protein [Tricholoma matsutake]|nr:Pkinase-domain-containing protein [Tricholoma matsutake 945]
MELLFPPPSPVESDTVQTPYVDNPDCYEVVTSPGKRQIFRLHTHSHEKESKCEFAPNNCHSQKNPNLSPVGNRASLLPGSKVTPLDYGSPMSDDDLVRSFCDAFILDMDRPQRDAFPTLATTTCLPKDIGGMRAEQSHLGPCDNINARFYSRNFPINHTLNPQFVRTYALGDELGSGGYGFVMTAHHRIEYYEVAVKFIIKKRVPEHAWMENDAIGRLPTEVVLLSFLDHENIVKCLDLFEDSLYFYLVQELHGSPWHKSQKNPPKSTSRSSLSPRCPTPALSPSGSTSSLDSLEQSSSPHSPSPLGEYPGTPQKFAYEKEARLRVTTLPNLDTLTSTTLHRPQYSRRASHDLFECIEQSEHKRLSEDQARYVFSQVVDAVHYLDSQGITHRDIKDENLVIDKNLKVKLIDFGSAAVVDTNKPRPYYDEFYGTVEYAAPEILLHRDYQAAPAEIWTLGVLLSYLLTGTSQFLTMRDAINGQFTVAHVRGAKPSRAAIDLMSVCLDPNVQTRATISEVKSHRWLTQEGT